MGSAVYPICKVHQIRDVLRKEVDGPGRILFSEESHPVLAYQGFS
jgi:hypothetical protein